MSTERNIIISGFPLSNWKVYGLPLDMALWPYGSWVKPGTSLLSLNTDKTRSHMSTAIWAHTFQALHSLLIISLKPLFKFILKKKNIKNI